MNSSQVCPNFQTSCKNPCVPFHLKSLWNSTYNPKNMDSCGNENDYACAVNFLNFQYGLKNKDCPQNLVDVYYKGAFEETQYKGAKYLADDHIQYFVWFPGNSKMVYEEYLVYDFNGMLGSIGGSLGMFLGFSFFDLICHFLSLI